jgi:hypothetical protein
MSERRVLLVEEKMVGQSKGKRRRKVKRKKKK